MFPISLPAEVGRFPASAIFLHLLADALATERAALPRPGGHRRDVLAVRRGQAQAN
jgi:hypothetical protein